MLYQDNHAQQLNPNSNPSPMPQDRLLDVEGLTVSFGIGASKVVGVKDLNFHVNRSEVLSIVGESGSGKSVSSMAVMRIVEFGGGHIESGRLRLRKRDGDVVDLRNQNPDELRRIRGSEVAMIFQEPMTSLNPVFTVGEQISEALRLHQGGSSPEIRDSALQMLDKVRMPNAASILKRYPHELSGGMRQRAMIAMALSCRPTLLIADEPTTALDVTVQAQILTLIRELQDEMDMGVIFITHDLGVVAEVADRVLVMRQGLKVEEGGVHDIYAHQRHEYTRALMSAVPRLGDMKGITSPTRFKIVSEPDAPAKAAKETDNSPAEDPLLKVRDLTTRFNIREGVFGRVKQRVHAVEKVSFDVYPGETLALVGESGCGKTTAGRTLLQLAPAYSGSVCFDGQDVTKNSKISQRMIRRNIQLIFQDPYSSLDPRLKVGKSILEPLRVMGSLSHKAQQEKLDWLMEKVGLPPSMANRYPHEFSGGQRQRISIARALAVNPKIVVADEAVSALDVSVQAQVVNLMMDLQEEFGTSYLFISHDMAVVERVSHRVAVMYMGQIVEIGPREAVFRDPQHPYTRKLMAAVPNPDPSKRKPKRVTDVKDLPTPIRKVGDEPLVKPLVEVGPRHFVARHPVGDFR